MSGKSAAESNPTESLAAGDYLSLTTFRKDGTAVATPVWVMRQGEDLFVFTGAESGKVKRLRNNSAVQLASCDVRGKIRGNQYPGEAEILPDSATDTVRSLMIKKYGWQARALGLMKAVQAFPRQLLGKPADPGWVGLRINLGRSDDSGSA